MGEGVTLRREPSLLKQCVYLRKTVPRSIGVSDKLAVMCESEEPLNLRGQQSVVIGETELTGRNWSRSCLMYGDAVPTSADRPSARRWIFAGEGSDGDLM